MTISLDWEPSAYVAYRCRCCRENCINDHRAARTKYQECKDCFSLPDLDRSSRTPSDRTAERGSRRSGAAGSEGLPLDPEAVAHERPEGAKREAVTQSGQE